MRTRSRRNGGRGVALLVVMLMVFAMAVIVSAFAYTMRVETRLAVKTQSEAELEWLGRSGIEMAKWVLALSRQIPGEQTYDGLNQFWAGGPGPTNIVEDVFAGVSLRDVPVGEGTISVEIVDTERKLNVNTLVQRSPQLMELVLQVCGAGAADATDITAALRDWIDPDDQPGMGAAAESGFYLGLDPPYVAKNGPVEEISELLKVRGVSPGLFWGPRSGLDVMSAHASDRNRRGSATYLAQGIAGSIGLADVLCALSSGQVNINTAPFPVLVLACGGDENIARNILEQRAGPDGVEGTFDDMPARNPGEIGRLQGVPVVPNQGAPLATFTTASTTFEVRVDAKLGTLTRRYTGVLRRTNLRDMPLLTFRRE